MAYGYDPITGETEQEDDSGLWYWFLVPAILILVGLLLDAQ